MQKNNLREKAIKAINDTFFILRKEKIDCYLWLKEDQTGVFQDKELGSSITNFYK